MSQQQFNYWFRRLESLTARDHQSSVYLLGNLAQALHIVEPTYTTESRRVQGRTQYRVTASLTNWDTTSPWESSVGVAKRKAALLILEALFRRYGASDEIPRLRERAVRFEEYRPARSTPGKIQCPLCPDVGETSGLVEHLEAHVEAEVNEALRSSRAENGRLRTERDRAIDELTNTRSELTNTRSELERTRRELEEARRQAHVNDFTCPICLEPVPKEKAMAPDCGHVICEGCERSWTQSLEDQNPPGYRCPSCNLQSTPVRLF